jgi:hypothetical protein
LGERSRKKAGAEDGVLNGMLSSGQAEKGEAGEEQGKEHAHHFC